MKSRDLSLLAESQYKTADNLHARWNLYNYCEPPIDIYQKALGDLQLAGTEAILDIGCGDGSVLLSLREQHDHTGPLTGMEISNTMMQPAIDHLHANPELRPVNFVVGSADKLPFADKSLDVMLAFFMLYHVPDIPRALAEWKRVLKPGGKLLVSTASRYNRPQAKALKAGMAAAAHTKAHPKFSTTFDLENAREQLEADFRVVDEYIYQGEIRVSQPEIYMAAMESDRDMYDPLPDDAAWEKARQYALGSISGVIAAKGYFTDPVRRGYFICQPT